MEWVFDADRRIEKQLGYLPEAKETGTDLLYIIVELQVHKDGNIINATLPLSYFAKDQVKDPLFILHMAIQMGIDMCLDHARKTGEMSPDYWTPLR